RAHLAQLGGTVRSEDQQRDPGVVGLHHGGVQVRGRGAGGGDHGGGMRRVVPGQAQRRERGGALVDAHVRADPTGEFFPGERVDERGGAGAGGEGRLAQAEGRERGPQGDGLIDRPGAGGRGGGERQGGLVHPVRVVPTRRRGPGGSAWQSRQE